MKLYETIARSLAENTYGNYSDFVDGKTLVDTHWTLWKTDSIVSTKSFLSWLKTFPPETDLKDIVEHIQKELKDV